MIISDDRWNDLVDAIKSAGIPAQELALEAAVESSAPLVGYVMHRSVLEQHRGLVAHLISENGTGGSDLNRADEILDALAKATHPLDADDLPMPTCTECGAYHEIVRMGKTQPTCLCEAYHRLEDEIVILKDRVDELTASEGALTIRCGNQDHAFEELSTANKANIERWQKAESCLKALVDKLRTIQADPSYQGMWTFLSAHNYYYMGPDWSAEALAATAVLS